MKGCRIYTRARTHTYIHRHRRGRTRREGWTNGWSRLATPMRGLKARAKMADVHEIRGASVTARSSAPVRRGFPFRWLPPTHPLARICAEVNPLSANVGANATLRAAPTSRTSAPTDPRRIPIRPTGADSALLLPSPFGRVHPRSAPRRPVSAKKCRASGQEYRVIYTAPRVSVSDNPPCAWQWRAGGAWFPFPLLAGVIPVCHPRGVPRGTGILVT